LGIRIAFHFPSFGLKYRHLLASRMAGARPRRGSGHQRERGSSIQAMVQSFLMLFLAGILHRAEGGKIVVFQFGSPLPNSHFMVGNKIIEELASRNQTVLVRPSGDRCGAGDHADAT
jgi:hypothetical protein